MQTHTRINYGLEMTGGSHLKEPTYAFSFKGHEVWGGSQSQMLDMPAPVRLRVLLNSFDPIDERTVVLNDGAAELGLGELETQGVPTINIHWPDGSTPRLNRAWWIKLVQLLETKVPGGKIFVGCTGGFGRTGTALAILAHFLGITKTAEDPVAFIRDVYDPFAVETSAQVNYVERMTGVDTSKSLSVWLAQPLPEKRGRKSSKRRREVLGQQTQQLWPDPEDQTHE